MHRCALAEAPRTVVRRPEAEGGVQALTALQEDLLEGAEARTQLRVVEAGPRQVGLPVVAPIGRSRSPFVAAVIPGSPFDEPGMQR
jgi:hypothetical protein